MKTSRYAIPLALAMAATAVAVVAVRRDATPRGIAAPAAAPSPGPSSAAALDRAPDEGAHPVETAERRTSVGDAASSSTASAAVDGASLKLRIVDADSGEPLAEHPFALFSEKPELHPLETGATDARGEAVVAHLGEGLYLLGTARRPPHAAALGAVWLSEGERGDLTLRVGRGGAIEGRVVDESGDPVSGVRVDVRLSRAGALCSGRLPDNWPPSRPPSGYPVTTDTEGRYRIDAVQSDLEGVWLVEGELRPERWLPVELVFDHEGVQSTLDVQVPVGETVRAPDQVVPMHCVWTGRVVDADGLPVSGALVSANVQRRANAVTIGSRQRPELCTPPGRPGFVLEAGEVLSAANGAFEVTAPSPVDQRVHGIVWTVDGVAVRVTFPPAGSGRRADGVELVVPRCTVLSLELFDPDGERITRPLLGEGVRVTSQLGSGLSRQVSFFLDVLGGGWSRVEDNADADGVFRLAFDTAPAPLGRLAVHVPGYRAGTVDDAATLLEGPGRLTLVPLPRIRVLFRPPDEPPGVWTPTHLRELATGFTAIASSVEPSTPDATLRCGLGSSIRVDLAHGPVEHALPVQVERPFWLYLVHAPHGGERILLHAGPFEPGDELHEVVVPAELLEALRFGTEDAAEAEPPPPSEPGAPEADEHEGRAGLVVRFVDANTGEPPTVLGFAQLRAEAGYVAARRVDREGTCRFSELEEGPRTLTVYLTGYRQHEPIEVLLVNDREIDVGTLEVTPWPVLRGRLVEADGGSPRETYAVTARFASGADGESTGFARVGADGRFELRANLGDRVGLDVHSMFMSQQVCVERTSEEQVVELAPWREVELSVVGIPDEFQHARLQLKVYVEMCDGVSVPSAVDGFIRAAVYPRDSIPQFDGRRSYHCRLGVGTYRVSGSGPLIEVDPSIVDVPAGEGLLTITLLVH